MYGDQFGEFVPVYWGLRYHPPSSTLLALIGASAFAFNKYPQKPYIF